MHFNEEKLYEKTVFYICILMVLSIILCVGCYNGDTNIPQCTEAPIVTATISPDTIINEEQGNEEQINEEQPEVRPHSESSYENMIAFLNNVDENTLGEGRFKNVINMIRDDGYILRPYFNGKPATIAIRNDKQKLNLDPLFSNGGVEDIFAWYRDTANGKTYDYFISIFYVKEEHLDECDTHGIAGVIAAIHGNYAEKVISKEFENGRKYIKVQTCGEEKNIVLGNREKEGYEYAEFQYDDFGIRVRFYPKSEGVGVTEDEAIEILNFLSFEKVYLN